MSDAEPDVRPPSGGEPKNSSSVACWNVNFFRKPAARAAVIVSDPLPPRPGRPPRPPPPLLPSDEADERELCDDVDAREKSIVAAEPAAAAAAADDDADSE